MTVITNTQPFIGQHCESTTIGTLLTQLSIYLSEPMIFGLGEGLGFAIFNMKTLDFPFIGGRIKPDLLTVNLSKNLGLKLITNETNSKNKAWKTVKSLIDNNKAVGLKLDCYHLDYFSILYILLLIMLRCLAMMIKRLTLLTLNSKEQKLQLPLKV